MKASPRRNVPTYSGKPSQKSGGCYRSKGGTNSILMSMILEVDVRWCSHTFGHVVYFKKRVLLLLFYYAQLMRPLDDVRPKAISPSA
jgi:hypothetical protein